MQEVNRKFTPLSERMAEDKAIPDRLHNVATALADALQEVATQGAVVLDARRNAQQANERLAAAHERLMDLNRDFMSMLRDLDIDPSLPQAAPDPYPTRSSR